MVGTGGTMHYALGAPLPGTEVQNSGAFGVLKLTLHDGSYDWRFIAQDGKSFTDSGSKDCSPLPGPAEPPDTTIDSGPSGTVQSAAASFGFSGSGGARVVRMLAGHGHLRRVHLAQGLLRPGRR